MGVTPADIARKTFDQQVKLAPVGSIDQAKVAAYVTAAEELFESTSLRWMQLGREGKVATFEISIPDSEIFKKVDPGIVDFDDVWGERKEALNQFVRNLQAAGYKVSRDQNVNARMGTRENIKIRFKDPAM